MKSGEIKRRRQECGSIASCTILLLIKGWDFLVGNQMRETRKQQEWISVDKKRGGFVGKRCN